MELKEKEIYVAPTIEVVEVNVEGVVCASGEGKSPWEIDD